MNGPWLTDIAHILGESGDPLLSNKIYQWAVKGFTMKNLWAIGPLEFTLNSNMVYL